MITLLPLVSSTQVRSGPPAAYKGKHMRRATVLAIIVLTLTTIVGYRLATVIYAGNVLQPMNGVSLSGGNAPMGTTFDHGVQFVSTQRGRTLIVRPATLPNGVPPHLHLVHQMIVVGGGFIGTTGWPPQNRPRRYYPTRSPNGYRLEPHQGATIGLAFVADRPGTYLVGPVTIHVDVQGPFGRVFPSEHTYDQYGLICVQVSRQTCEAARLASPPNER